MTEIEKIKKIIRPTTSCGGCDSTTSNACNKCANELTDDLANDIEQYVLKAVIEVHEHYIGQELVSFADEEILVELRKKLKK